MTDKFLKLVKGAVAVRQETARKTLEFEKKLGKAQLIKGIANLGGAIVDADPADFLDENSRPIPIHKLPPAIRRMADFSLNEDGVAVAAPPTQQIKLMWSKIILQAIGEAREQNIDLAPENAGAKEKPQPFIVNITEAEKSAGARMIAQARGDIEMEVEDAEIEEAEGNVVRKKI